MGLRLTEGLDLAALSARLALPEAELCDMGRLAFLSSQGLAWHRGARIGVTVKGMPLLDAILGELVPETLVSEA